MASTPWQISGQYFETCSCDFLCPCITSNLAARPTQGSCTVAIALHVEQGQFGGTDLAGHAVRGAAALGFPVMTRSHSFFDPVQDKVEDIEVSQTAGARDVPIRGRQWV